jgi:hypothetical protein
LTQFSRQAGQQAANLPQYSPYSGPNPYAGLTPDQLQALGVAQNQTGASVAGSAVPFAQQYAGFQAPQISTGQIGADTQALMNPYIQSVINATNAQIDRNTTGAVSNQDATLAGQGAFGGDRQGIADAVTRGLAEQQKATTTANLMSGGYGSAQQAALSALQGNQQAALGGAQVGLGGVNALSGLGQGLGGLNAQTLQALLQAGGTQQQTGTNQGMFNYQNWMNQFQIPENIASTFGGVLGSLPHSTSQTGTMTGTAYSNPLSSALGLGALFQGLGGASGLGSLGSSALTGFGNAVGAGANLLGLLPFSDRRLKEDVQPIGKLADETPIYRFRYHGDPIPRVGLMSDEVDPAAVVKHPSGYDMVDYGRATDRAARVEAFNALRGIF